jgi:CheY-like chemotaxis protein
MAVILIVDDEPDCADPVALFLRKEGHQPICVRDGPAALAELANRAVDLVLLDLMMPTMDGLDVLSQVRADPRWTKLPVVVMSAVDEPRFVDRVRRFRADAFLVKSRFDFSDLRRQVQRSLGAISPPSRPRGKGLGDNPGAII